MNQRIPIHHDAYCAFHDLPVEHSGMCRECLKEGEVGGVIEMELPDLFDEVLGG